MKYAKTRPLSSLLTLPLNYSIPSGWSVKKEIIDFINNTKYENLTIQKGDYILSIGDQDTGTARCDEYYNNIPYITLNNDLLGELVIRVIPNKNAVFNYVYVCSNINKKSPSDMIYGTKIGHIKYQFPPNWHEETLKEMDGIVNSLKLIE